MPQDVAYCRVCGGPCKVWLAPADRAMLPTDWQPKMEPRKADSDLIAKIDFEDATGTLFSMLWSRQSNLREAKRVLGCSDALLMGNGGDGFSRGGCRLKLTKQEMLNGIDRELNEIEDRIQKSARDIRATLTDLINALDYRPPIEAEA